MVYELTKNLLWGPKVFRLFIYALQNWRYLIKIKEYELSVPGKYFNISQNHASHCIADLSLHILPIL